MRSQSIVPMKRSSKLKRRLVLFLSLISIGTLATSYLFVAEAQKKTNKAQTSTGQSSRQSKSNEEPERASMKRSTNGKSGNSKTTNLRKGESNVKVQDPKDGETLVLPMEYFGVSEPLEKLATRSASRRAFQGEDDGGMLQEDEMEPLQEAPEKTTTLRSSQNLQSASVQNEVVSAMAANPGANFEGPGVGMPGFVIAGAPPDTTMAVGPNHIVAWVNSQYAVFDKAGNALLPAPGFVNGNTLFTGMGNVCETTNRGDPILQYDRLANRWFLSQFAFNVTAGNASAPYLQCIAVSTTGNPMGTYNRYTISFSSVAPSGLNDYGKLGVWPDAYYTSYNIFQGTPAGANSGAALCASDRTKMLAGDPTATTLCAPITFYAGGAALLPADLDGTTLPTDITQGGIFIRQSTAPALRLLKLKPNFAASTVTITDGFGGVAGSFINIPLPATNRPCNGSGGTCVRQPGTPTQLDTLGDRVLYRAAYRNRGGVDSLVVTQGVDPDGAGARGAVSRWYEIRSPLSAAPVLFQLGTYDPGASGDRWMGSVAMDKDGNMLLGYSSVNVDTGLKPSLAVAGRLVTDPINTLQAEQVIITGTGSQTIRSTGQALTRWGDYTTMQIDPSDDATFWFIGQYLSADGVFNWRTRIASFKFAPNLASGGASIVNESCPPTNGSIDPGETASVNLNVTNSGSVATTNLVGTLMPSGNVIAPSGPQNYGVVAPSGTTGRNFTFTASGAVGTPISLVLHLQDGANDLGNVSYTFTLGNNTACQGSPLVTTSTVLSCQGGNTVAAITVTNSGTATANNVMLTTAKIGAVSGTPLPQSSVTLAPGTSVVTTVTFSGAPFGLTTLQVGGTYTGGTFSSSRRISAPNCGVAQLFPKRTFDPTLSGWLTPTSPISVLTGR